MAQIGNINLKLNFQNSGDPQLLLIGDYSYWGVIENLPATISITIPGSSNPIEYSFVKHSIQSYNSSSLYLSCEECDYSDLPDGIYSATINGSRQRRSETVYYLKTDLLDLEISKRFVDVGFQWNDESKRLAEYLFKTKAFIEAAKSHTMLGDIQQASIFFKEAQNQINCKKCH